MAKKAAKKKTAKKAAPVVITGEMDKREIASAFNVPESDPQRRAWTQLLNEFIENAITQTENPAIFDHHGLLASAAGGQLALRSFKDEVEARFKTSHDVLAGLDKPKQQSTGYGAGK